MTQPQNFPQGLAQANQSYGITQTASHRLAELGDDQGKIFTSDLSVNEFALIKQAGFHPLGLVLGSLIYHVAPQLGRWGKNQELVGISQAMYHARELAMSRMTAEARALQADGMVSVLLRIESKEFLDGALEFIAIGTAVKAESVQSEYTWKLADGAPFNSNLSGQDFWTLLQTGHAPVGLVMGSCVYHIAHQKLRNAWATATSNVEIPEYTQGLYEAREIAMIRIKWKQKDCKLKGL